MEALLLQGLASFGPAGVVVAYLILQQRKSDADLKEGQALLKESRAETTAAREAHLADIKQFSASISASLATNTELIRANNGIQEKAAASAALIAEAVREVSFRLGQLEESVGELKP